MLLWKSKNIGAKCYFKNFDVGGEERAQQLRALVALAGDQDLVASTHKLAHHHPLILVLEYPIISDLLRNQNTNDTHAYM